MPEYSEIDNKGFSISEDHSYVDNKKDKGLSSGEMHTSMSDHSLEGNFKQSQTYKTMVQT